MIADEVYNDLATIMQEVSGEDVKVHTRRLPVPILRFMIYDKMHKAGFSLPVIGRTAGYNHATVLHGIQTIRTMIEHPMMFWDVIQTYYKFNDKSNEYIQQRTDDLPLAVRG